MRSADCGARSQDGLEMRRFQYRRFGNELTQSEMSMDFHRKRPDPKSKGAGNAPLWMRRQMVVRLRIPVSCITSWQVRSSWIVMVFLPNQSGEQHRAGPCPQ